MLPQKTTVSGIQTEMVRKWYRVFTISHVIFYCPLFLFYSGGLVIVKASWLSAVWLIRQTRLGWIHCDALSSPIHVLQQTFRYFFKNNHDWGKGWRCILEWQNKQNRAYCNVNQGVWVTILRFFIYKKHWYDLL